MNHNKHKHAMKTCHKKQCRHHAKRLKELEVWYNDARNTITKQIEEIKQAKLTQVSIREERILSLKGQLVQSMAVAMESLAHTLDDKHLGK